jgi:hypothetical protein
LGVYFVVLKAINNFVGINFFDEFWEYFYIDFKPLPTQKDSIILGEQTLSSSYTYHDGLGT